MSTPGGYGNLAGREDEIAVVRAIYEAFARRDVEEALRHIDETIEFVPAGTLGLTGRAEPYRGHDGVREYFADAATVWDELTLHAEDFRVVAGGVVVFGRVEGTRREGPYRAAAVWIWQVRDGKAVSMRVNPVSGAPRPGPSSPPRDD